jgi:hypothetical protein
MGEMYSTKRLAEVVEELAERSQDPPVRTQLHALVGVIANLGIEDPDLGRRAELERRIEAGMAAGEEDAVLAAMAALAALERAPLRRVDWSAASSG